MTSFLLSLLLLLHLLHLSLSSSISIDRLHARLSAPVAGERQTRHSFSATPQTLLTPSTTPVTATTSDTLIIQISISKDGKGFVPQQAFVRVFDRSRRKEAIYIMQEKRGNMRVDLDIGKEVMKNNGEDFFSEGRPYEIAVIVGDVDMDKGFTWILSRDIYFKGDVLKRIQERKNSGVFNFDLRVKKELLPEFETEIAPQGKRTPAIVVIVFVALVLAPLIGLLAVWSKLGVWPLALPKGQDLLFFVGFQLCVLTQIVVLILFWVGVNGINILETWKWLGVIMFPTLICGHRTLSNVASRDALAIEGKGKSKGDEKGSSPSRKPTRTKKTE